MLMPNNFHGPFLYLTLEPILQEESVQEKMAEVNGVWIPEEAATINIDAQT